MIINPPIPTGSLIEVRNKRYVASISNYYCEIDCCYKRRYVFRWIADDTGEAGYLDTDMFGETRTLEQVSDAIKKGIIKTI